jgi:hypothetical protein
MAKRQLDESFMKDVISGGLPYKPERKRAKADVKVTEVFDPDTFGEESETTVTPQINASVQSKSMTDVPSAEEAVLLEESESAKRVESPKDKRMTFEEYEERFLTNVRTHMKASFMIDRNLIMMIKKVIYETDSSVSAASYIHNILVFHFEEFRDIINKTTNKIKKPTIPQKL